jgi:hypothetical protein
MFVVLQSSAFAYRTPRNAPKELEEIDPGVADAELTL